MNTLFKELDYFASNYPWAPAIIDDRNVYNFHLLKQLVDIATQYLLNKRIDKNKRIALKFSNSSLHLINSLALIKIGACQLSFESAEEPESINKGLASCKIDIIISDSPIRACSVEQILVDTSLFLNLENPSIINIPPISLDNIALLTIGSGTTGDAKIIPTRFSQLQSTIFERKDLLGVKQGDRFLSLAPISSHVGKLRTLFALSKGLTNVFLDHVNAQLPIFLDRLAVNFLYLTDAHANLLIQLLESKNSPLALSESPRYPLLKALIISGSPISTEKINFIKKRLCQNLYLIYATNETSVVTMATPKLLEEKPSCVGITLPECRVEIVNNDKDILPIGEIGNIRIQAKGMSDHYENNTKATEESFDGQWFYPKDLGKIDKEGVLYFEGRSDDLIFFDGTNIFPREIELIINKLPDVEDSAAFPITQNNKIVPAVCIELKPDSKLKNNDETLQYFSDCLQKEMGWKRPRQISIMGTLPRNKRGKIEKFKLREIFKN